MCGPDSRNYDIDAAAVLQYSALTSDSMVRQSTRSRERVRGSDGDRSYRPLRRTDHGFESTSVRGWGFTTRSTATSRGVHLDADALNLDGAQKLLQSLGIWHEGSKILEMRLSNRGGVDVLVDSD